MKKNRSFIVAVLSEHPKDGDLAFDSMMMALAVYLGVDNTLIRDCSWKKLTQKTKSPRSVEREGLSQWKSGCCKHIRVDKIKSHPTHDMPASVLLEHFQPIFMESQAEPGC